MMVWTLGWLGASAAHAVDVGIDGVVAVGDAERTSPTWYGLQGALEWPGPGALPVAWGLRARGGLSEAGTGLLAVEPTARVWFNGARRGLSLALGVGGHLEGQLTPVLSPGLALDLGSGSRPWRLGATYHWRANPDAWRLAFAIGRVFGPAPEPEPEPVPPSWMSRLQTERGMLWLPSPVCAWLPPDTVDTSEGALAPLSRVDDRGFSPFGDAAAPPVPPQPGQLVVAAWPGDEAELNGVRLPLGDDGLGVITLEEPESSLVIVGGGRRVEHQLLVGDDLALWISAPPPRPVSIRFDLGSAALRPEAEAQLDALADAAGGWKLEVRGGHSPEGEAGRNAELALLRAAVVQEALQQRGLDPTKVAVSEERAEIGDAEDIATMRVAVVYPVLEEAP